MAYMISINASDRFQIGDRVEWTSKSGNPYSGTITRIREDRSEDLYQRGALVTVEVSEGVFRNFYENEVDAHHLV